MPRLLTRAPRTRGEVVVVDFPVMRTFKVVVEKHVDGYVAYPLGIQGAVVGQGASYDEALADLTSALRFHAETFGTGDLEAFVAEARVDLGAAVPG